MEDFVTTEYSLKLDNVDKKLTVAILSDLHSSPFTDVTAMISILREKRPDYILMPGDIFERLDGNRTEWTQAGLELMRSAAEIAPVMYSFGNHENGGFGSWNFLKWRKKYFLPKYFSPEELDLIFESGATVLDDAYVFVDGIAFGGLTSGFINQGRKPNIDWLDGFCALSSPKILLCHHPEYYKKYLTNKNIDLIVSGHAHGGQWRFFGRGLFAPGQGIFPKYTSGVHDGRFVISRGLKGGGKIPRIFNKPEIVFLNIN